MQEMAALLEETVRLAAAAMRHAWLRLAEYQFKTGRARRAPKKGYQHRLALIPDDPYARLEKRR